MITHPVLLVVCLAAAASVPSALHASDDWRDIQVGENSLVYTDQDLQIRGAWLAMADYRLPRTPRVNASVLVCVKSSMTCVESATHIEPLRNRPTGASPYLSVFTFEYAVQNWNAESLVAKRFNPRGISMNETLSVNVVKGVVQKQWVDKPRSDGYYEPADQSFQIMIKTPYRM